MQSIDSGEVVPVPSMKQGKPRWLHVKFEIQNDDDEQLDSFWEGDFWLPDTLDRDGTVRAQVGAALTQFLEDITGE